MTLAYGRISAKREEIADANVFLPASILFQYRIFPVASFRRIIIACGVFVIAFEVASTIVYIFQCTPVDGFWTRLGGGAKGAHCISFRNFLLTNGIVNTVTDFALILLVSNCIDLRKVLVSTNNRHSRCRYSGA